MKIFGRGRYESCWCLLISVVIIILLSHQSIASPTDSENEEGGSASNVAIEVGEGDTDQDDPHHHHHHNETDQNHNEHHNHQEHDGHESDDDVSASGEVSSRLNDHDHNNHDDDDDATDVHHSHGHSQAVVRGHGESCGDAHEGAAVTCDTAAGLICAANVGTCECDKNAGEVYSTELGKCEQAPPHHVTPEVHNNSLEEEHEEEEKESSDAIHNVQNHDEPNPTEAAVLDSGKENSLEEEDTVEKEQAPSVMAVDHRTDHDDHDDHDHHDGHAHDGHDNHDEHDGVDKSEEKGILLGGVGKCANVNCEDTLGKYSTCDEETGECQCNDVENLDRSLIVKDDKCVIIRHINDPCSTHEECAATIGGQAWCHMDVVTSKRFCQCELFHYFDDSLKECLPFASNGLFSPCKTDMQCTGSDVKITGHGLGPNAHCSQEKSHCECKMGPDGQKAFLYENYCFYQMMPGEHCVLDRECEVSFPGQDVGCVDESCMCRNGENITAVSCPLDPSEMLGGSRRVHGQVGEESTDKDGDQSALDNLKSAMGLDLSNIVFIMVIGAVVLLIVVVLSVFFIRKRHKYSVVRTREPTE